MSHATPSNLDKLRRGMLRAAFVAAAGLIVAGHTVKIHDDVVLATSTAPAERTLYDNDLFDLARKAGSIISGVAADRRRVASIDKRVESENMAGGGHIVWPNRSP